MLLEFFDYTEGVFLCVSISRALGVKSKHPESRCSRSISVALGDHILVEVLLERVLNIDDERATKRNRASERASERDI